MNNAKFVSVGVGQGTDYPLQWLDQLINVSLKPERLNKRSVQQEDVRTINELIAEENNKLQLLIKSQVFQSSTLEEVEKIIHNYHSSLILLLNQTLTNNTKLNARKKTAVSLYKSIIEHLENLLSFVENHFAGYLTPDDLVPPTALKDMKQELEDRMREVKSRIAKSKQPEGLMKLVLNRIYDFINGEPTSAVAYRAINYRQQLVYRLENTPYEKSPEEGYSALDKALIFMNFNSKHYIDKLTRFIRKKVDGNGTAEEKLDKLHFYYKEFKQMQRNEQVIFNPENPSLLEVMENWFDHEIRYREKVVETISALRPNEQITTQPDFANSLKVMCNLSGDQISLILRAADETKLVSATSLSEVFNSIVPFLSTKRKRDLSPNAVRGKSYDAEDRDKEVAIEALLRMIEKIKGY